MKMMLTISEIQSKMTRIKKKSDMTTTSIIIFLLLISGIFSVILDHGMIAVNPLSFIRKNWN